MEKKKKGPIVYDVRSLHNGWVIEVTLPSGTVASDRLKTLDYLRDYKRQVSSMHPEWLVSVLPEDDTMRLTILRSFNLKDLAELSCSHAGTC